jgi:hypothetical protein
MECSTGQTMPDLKDIGTWIKRKDKASSGTPQVTTTKENFSTTWPMAMEFICMLMEVFIPDISKMIFSTVKVRRNGLMAQNL